jgi:hypothetical protein
MTSFLATQAKDFTIQSRSNYQLQKFVVGQHDTPEMRFRQIIIEAKDLLYKIQRNELGIEIKKRKIQKLLASKDEVKHLKAAQLQLDLSVTLEALEGARRELDYLVELSKDYRHYTPDEIEANQEDYWELRLTRQATTDRMALEQGIDKGNLASMMNAGLVQKELTQ